MHSYLIATTLVEVGSGDVAVLFFPDQLMTVVAYITKAIGNGKFCECGSVHIQKPYGVVARASSLL